MNMNILIIRTSTLGMQALKKIAKCCYATASKSTSVVTQLEVEEVPVYEIETYDEERIEKLRNKSRLHPAHRNVLHDRKPHDVSYLQYHDSIKYRKKLLGRYGILAMGISPAVAWPTKDDIEDAKEYESLAYPKSIQEVWKDIEETKRLEAEEIRKREEKIDEVIGKLDKWKADLQAKIAQKEAALLEAKKQKERAMEEIREQFGYNIDPRDERVKEMLAQKEKEDKKKKKAEKKKRREEKLLAYLEKQNKAEENTEGDQEQSGKNAIDNNNIALKSTEISDDQK